VGDPNNDHQCWERPEDMDTARTAYKVDAGHPGSDVAGETAAALAAASIAFQGVDNGYSTRLLAGARRVSGIKFLRNYEYIMHIWAIPRMTGYFHVWLVYHADRDSSC